MAQYAGSGNGHFGWVDWFNNHRLLGPIANSPPAEAEENSYAHRDVLDMVA